MFNVLRAEISHRIWLLGFLKIIAVLIHNGCSPKCICSSTCLWFDTSSCRSYFLHVCASCSRQSWPAGMSETRVTDTRDLEAISRLAASDSYVPDLPSLRRVSPLLSSPSWTSFFLKPSALLSPPFHLFAIPLTLKWCDIDSMITFPCCLNTFVTLEEDRKQ